MKKSTGWIHENKNSWNVLFCQFAKNSRFSSYSIQKKIGNKREWYLNNSVKVQSTIKQIACKQGKRSITEELCANWVMLRCLVEESWYGGVRGCATVNVWADYYGFNFCGLCVVLIRGTAGRSKGCGFETGRKSSGRAFGLKRHNASAKTLSSWHRSSHKEKQK